MQFYPAKILGVFNSRVDFLAQWRAAVWLRGASTAEDVSFTCRTHSLWFWYQVSATLSAWFLPLSSPVDFCFWAPLPAVTSINLLSFSILPSISKNHPLCDCSLIDSSCCLTALAHLAVLWPSRVTGLFASIPGDPWVTFVVACPWLAMLCFGFQWVFLPESNPCRSAAPHMNGCSILSLTTAEWVQAAHWNLWKRTVHLLFSSLSLEFLVRLRNLLGGPNDNSGCVCVCEGGGGKERREGGGEKRMRKINLSTYSWNKILSF